METLFKDIRYGVRGLVKRPGVRQVIREVDPDQPVSNVATMAELLGTEASQRRMGMIMLVALRYE